MFYMNITVFYGSSREISNSSLLANKVLNGLNFEAVHLQNMKIVPIEDKRHDLEGFSLPDDDYDQIIQQILKSDIIVFATPIYWYSMSGTMKVMIDRLSQAIRDERYPQLTEHLRTVKAIVLAVGGDNPKIKGLPMIQQFQYIFEFLGTSFEHYILAEGNRPGDILSDSRVLSEAKWLNGWLQSLVNQTRH